MKKIDSPLIANFDAALEATISAITPLPGETLPLAELVGRVTAREVRSLVDSPSLDVSLKDGYAVRSADVAQASPEHPITLTIIGDLAAGGSFDGAVESGTAVRILSGAPLPRGAQAVLAEEFTTVRGDRVTATADAGPGRNVMRRGDDVRRDEVVAPAGTRLRPAQVGLLAAAGQDRADVIRRPRVGIIATGDEVVAPGRDLEAGQLYASNLVTLQAWCTHEGMPTTVRVAPDEREAIRQALVETLETHDAIVTSGGAWKGDRDLVAALLDELGWRKVYHRIRLGPGKAVGFGLWQGKPVFILPGGPPSNQTAFLQLALPGLHRLAGRSQLGLPLHEARLAKTVRGQRDWTQFVEGRFEQGAQGLCFRPEKQKSRLQSMADCEGFLKIPEGVAQLDAGSRVAVQVVPHLPLLLSPSPAPTIKEPTTYE
ncbi:MAG: gephyrin-like molybdotransferase Glp [bacterium]